MGITCYKFEPMPELPETAELLAFATIVDKQSLSGAAIALRVPRATLSRRLSRLEERLGVRLLRRTTRSLALTDAGEALHRHARIVLDALGRAELSVRKPTGAVSGELRVSVPPTMVPGFSTMLCAFMRQYPDLRVHVHYASRHVDLIREGYDVAIRASRGQLEPGLVARTLSRMQLVAVASPAYLKARGTPRTPRDLKQHRCLMGFSRRETPETHWPTGRGQLHVEGAFFSNDLGLLAEAAVEGLGIALLPEPVVRPLIRGGELVPVLSGVLGTQGRASIVYAERELLPPQVRAFVDAVVAWAPTEFGPKLTQACETAVAQKRGRKPRG
jgi:DNA-binding transcriptional LysR family regulator